MKQVLVVCCHLDDEVIGLGGTIARHSDFGDRVYVANLCLSANNVARIQAGVPQVQEILGIRQFYICKLPHGELQAKAQESIGILEQIIDEIKPDVVYTHHRGDSHQDHRAAFFITMSALRLNRGAKVSDVSPRILSYEVLSSSERAAPFSSLAFLPNLYVDISSQLERKLAAARTYTTEIGRFPHPRSVEGIETLAKYRGMQAGVRAAEAFCLIRDVVKETDIDWQWLQAQPESDRVSATGLEVGRDGWQPAEVAKP